MFVRRAYRGVAEATIMHAFEATILRALTGGRDRRDVKVRRVVFDLAIAKGGRWMARVLDDVRG
jgi:hypothetical protein